MLEGSPGDAETGLQPFTPTSARDLCVFWKRTTDPV